MIPPYLIDHHAKTRDEIVDDIIHHAKLRDLALGHDHLLRRGHADIAVDPAGQSAEIRAGSVSGSGDILSSGHRVERAVSNVVRARETFRLGSRAHGAVQNVIAAGAGALRRVSKIVGIVCRVRCRGRILSGPVLLAAAATLRSGISVLRILRSLLAAPSAFGVGAAFLGALVLLVADILLGALLAPVIVFDRIVLEDRRVVELLPDVGSFCAPQSDRFLEKRSVRIEDRHACRLDEQHIFDGVGIHAGRDIQTVQDRVIILKDPVQAQTR